MTYTVGNFVATEEDAKVVCAFLDSWQIQTELR